jgi:hypothetical protein
MCFLAFFVFFFVLALFLELEQSIFWELSTLNQLFIKQKTIPLAFFRKKNNCLCCLMDDDGTFFDPGVPTILKCAN